MGGIFFFLMLLLLVIVHNFYVVSVPVVPPKANTPLVVYPDTVLPQPVSTEGLQPIPWGHAQGVEIRCRINHPELTHRHLLDAMREFPRQVPSKYLLGVFAPERFDHGAYITHPVNTVKRYLLAFIERTGAYAADLSQKTLVAPRESSSSNRVELNR